MNASSSYSSSRGSSRTQSLVRDAELLRQELGIIEDRITRAKRMSELRRTRTGRPESMGSQSQLSALGPASGSQKKTDYQWTIGSTTRDPTEISSLRAMLAARVKERQEAQSKFAIQRGTLPRPLTWQQGSAASRVRERELVRACETFIQKQLGQDVMRPVPFS